MVGTMTESERGLELRPVEVVRIEDTGSDSSSMTAATPTTGTSTVVPQSLLTIIADDDQEDRLEQDRIRVRDEWDLCTRDPYKASPESKYDRYQLQVDHEAGDRATEIKLFQWSRPHMRGLHFLLFSLYDLVRSGTAPQGDQGRFRSQQKGNLDE
jgi:hypothetical protein